ncbi:Protein containing DUF1551 OS=Rhodopirellula maiorica SM1 GN=RMSM_05043 PE=4 SV=1: DUF1551 [Gemmataceae bacterium]|nr:Protein containing DUF1551 OS=Rhodopirellula maiorica SM1 GN=RMSM_05043 PE=4 SV=1: DUF1551 [Gemmataceae bacterium]VTT96925.1 Protein containing DUF1551 OS=Rhodopirellula maiorica SM1 GN=RMSM_05043 PE=4 SV=1: DUF1551 [Gemmataceae bacterium]
MARTPIVLVAAAVLTAPVRGPGAEPPPPPVLAAEPTPGPRVWGSAEYLLWFTNPSPVPAPLVTSGSLFDALPGAIGQPGTRVLLGDQSLGAGAVRSGGRFSFGFQPEGWPLGAEFSYLFLGRHAAVAEATTSGYPGAPSVSVPFFDVTGTAGLNGVPGQSIYILGGPFLNKFFGLSPPDGTIPGVAAYYRLGLASQVQGAEANGAMLLRQSDRFRLDGLAGFRWLQFEEDLTFFGTGYGVPGGVFPGPETGFTDRFGTRNDFYGGQVGFRAAHTAGRWSVGATCKVALGVTHEQAAVSGAVTTPGGTLFVNTSGTIGQVAPGGVFTQPSNLGTYQRDVFAVAPEVKLDLGYAVTPRLKLSLGYTFLCISNVARPGNLIDPALNLTRTNLAALSRATSQLGVQNPIPFPGGPSKAPPAFGPAAPVFDFRDSAFWGQGVSFGLAYSY